MLFYKANRNRRGMGVFYRASSDLKNAEEQKRKLKNQRGTREQPQGAEDVQQR